MRLFLPYKAPPNPQIPHAYTSDTLSPKLTSPSRFHCPTFLFSLQHTHNTQLRWHPTPDLHSRHTSFPPSPFPSADARMIENLQDRDKNLHPAQHLRTYQHSLTRPSRLRLLPQSPHLLHHISSPHTPLQVQAREKAYSTKLSKSSQSQEKLHSKRKKRPENRASIAPNQIHSAAQPVPQTYHSPLK